MDELLPCPFCGGEAEVKRWVKSTFAIVVCKTKDCPCSSFGSNCYNNEQEAIEAWNTRAERTCEGCKHEGKSSLGEPCYSCTHVNYNDCYEKVSE